MCPGQKTYFDMAYNDSTEERSICWAATIEVSQIHSWKPLSGIEDKFHDLILGIQAQLWSETITKECYMDEMIKITGEKTVPQIFVGDKHIGGFEQLRSIYNNGNLDKLIHED